MKYKHFLLEGIEVMDRMKKSSVLIISPVQ